MAEQYSFSLDAVLSVTTGCLLSPMRDAVAVLDFMTGASIFTHQIPRARAVVVPLLLQAHPHLDTPQVQTQIAALALALERCDGRDARRACCAAWMEARRQELGAEVLLTQPDPLPDDFSRPLGDLMAMVGDTRRIIVVDAQDRTEEA
jgi:hypothetical protein